MAQISTETQDNEGITHLLSDSIVAMKFVDVEASLFANPDPGYSGYSADGFWYTSGEADPTNVPYKASWASEGEGDADSYRGTLDRFPDRIILIATSAEVVILDADTLDVWMRCVPHSGSTAYNYGSALGDTGTEIRDVAFVEGHLLVATSDGLRVLDFRGDRIFVLGESSGSYQSGPNSISSRNQDGVAEVGGTYGGGSQDTLVDDCLCVDAGVVGPAISSATGGIHVAAVGTTQGIVAVTLRSSSVTSPQVINHVNFKAASLGDWRASDDGDGDATTPYIEHNSLPETWEANHVRVGDTIRLLPSGLEVIVQAVDGGRLTVSPEIDITLSDTDCESERPVPSVHMTPAGGLLFANGEQLVTLATDDEWYSQVGGFADPRTISPAAKVVSTHESITAIHRVRYSGSSAYIATDQGIFVATSTTFDNSNGVNFARAAFRYSSPLAFLDADYQILEGSEVACFDVAVDPETGNILVAAVDSDAETCTVTEINPSIHQAFQFFDHTDLGGVVTCLLSYRNVEGPPDDESGVA